MTKKKKRPRLDSKNSGEMKVSKGDMKTSKRKDNKDRKLKKKQNDADKEL